MYLFRFFYFLKKNLGVRTQSTTGQLKTRKTGVSDGEKSLVEGKQSLLQMLQVLMKQRKS